MKFIGLTIILVFGLAIFAIFADFNGNAVAQTGSSHQGHSMQAMGKSAQKQNSDTGRCAYDGMLMMKSMMVPLKQGDETLYFCNEDQKKAFQKSPERYLKKVAVGNTYAFLNVLTMKEYTDMMGMKRENQNDTHWLSAYLDGNPQVKVSGIAVKVTTPDGKVSFQELKYDNMMKTYAGNFSFPEGKKYKVQLLLETPEIDVP